MNAPEIIHETPEPAAALFVADDDVRCIHCRREVAEPRSLLCATCGEVCRIQRMADE